jgi:hypothetical protein
MFQISVIILAVLLVGCAYAASVNEEEKVVEIIEAEHEDDHHDDDYHHNPRTRRPTRPNRKHEKPSQYNDQGYLVDYSMRCSSSPCYCSNVCMQWRPCNCVCPPPCPPPTTSTTTPEPEVSAGPICDNGAPNEFFPDCCFNGGRGRFCCVNGADNLHCCLNGANNPWCSLPTQPPSQVPTP